MMAPFESGTRDRPPRKRGICCPCCNYHGVCVCCTSIQMTCWRAFKWLPVLLISSIICWSYYAYVVQLCIFTVRNTVQQCVYLIIFHMLIFLMVWSYLRTIFTDIQRVPDKYKLPENEIEKLLSAESEEEQRSILENFAKDLPVVSRTSSGSVRYCNRCVLVKPDRAHHCSICAKCVLKMDHHCPWINNCVCFFNYKFFVLFLGYALLYCVFIAATCLPYFIKFWKMYEEFHEAHCDQILKNGNYSKYCMDLLAGEFGTAASTGRYHIVFAFFVSIMFAVSLGSLFFYHCYLVAHNRTTLESFRAPVFRGGPDKNGFSIGWYNNFKEVFGESPNLWFFPVSNSLGNGCDFPVRGEHELRGYTTPQETHGYESMGTTRSTLDAKDNETRPVSRARNLATLRVVRPSSAMTQAMTIGIGPLTDSLGDGIEFPQPAKGDDTESLLSSERWDRWGERARPFDDRDTSSCDDLFE